MADKKIIEARVWQKVDTEANWLANPLPLGAGEQAFVSDKNNFKVNTYPTKKTFAELEYFYKGDVIGNVTLSDDLNLKSDGVYYAQTSGTYGDVVVKEGYYTLLRKKGNTWSLELETKMPETIIDKVLDVNSENAIANSSVANQVLFIDSVTNVSLNLLNPLDIEDGAYNNSNGNAYSTSNAKRIKSKVITEDMIGVFTISGYGNTSTDFARVVVKNAQSELLLVIPAKNDNVTTFEITSSMVGSNLRITLGNTNLAPNGYENQVMYVKGNEVKPFSKYGEIVFDVEKIPTNEDKVIEIISQQGYLSNNDLTVEKSKNLFDKKTAKIGYISDVGVIRDDDNYRYSDNIKIEKGVTYSGKGINTSTNNSGIRFIAVYDSQGNILTDYGINAGANNSVFSFNISTVSTADYIVITIYKDALDSFQLEKGSKSTSYEDYGDFITAINDIRLKSNSNTYSQDVLRSNIICEGDSTTEGADLVNMENERWSTLLQSKLGDNYNVVNRGTSGGRAEEIISRISALNPIVMVTNGVISLESRNNLTYIDIDPLRSGSSNKTFTYPAMLVSYNGVVSEGYMTKNNSNKGFYAIKNYKTNVGDTELKLVSTANKNLNYGTRLNKNDLFIVGFGANNVPLIQSGTQTIEYLKQNIKNLFTSYHNVMYWGMTDREASELPIILEIEDYAIKEFGNRFCQVRRYLASEQSIKDAKKIELNFVETQEDIDRINQGLIPPSLKFSANSAHLNALGNKLQMNYIFNWLNQYYL